MAGWQRTLVIMSVAQLLSALGFSMVFPFLPNYVNDLGSAWGLSTVFLAGAVFSFQAITMMFTSPIWGAVADRVGRKPMVLRAMLGGAVILALQAGASSAEELVLWRTLQGVVTGVISANSALVASVTPRHRSGFALGTLQTALTSGVALGPLVGGILADNFGYRVAHVITAGLLLAGSLLVMFGVKEDFKPPKNARRLNGMLADWAHVFRTPGVSLTFLARFSAWLARGVLVPVLPLFVPFIVLSGQNLATYTGLVIGVAAFTSTLSAIYLGNLGDRIGHRPVLIASAFAAAVVHIPMGFVTEPWQLVALNALVGIAVGGVMPSLSAMLNVATDSGEIGSAFGLDNAVVAASRAVAPLLGVGVAALLGAGEFGYRTVFWVAGLLFVGVMLLGFRMNPQAPDGAQDKVEAEGTPARAKAG